MTIEYLKYKVINVDALNARKKPSLKGEVFSILKKNQVVNVVKNASKTADGITWYKIRFNNTDCWVSSKYLKRITPNYRKLVIEKAKIVYETVVKLGCQHKSGAKTLIQIQNKKITTCATSVSAVLQEAGILPKGKLISHTKAVGSSVAVKKKNTIAKAISGTSSLKAGTYKIIKMGKKFKNIPAKYRVAGTVLVYDSNIGIVKDSNSIYSTNNGASQKKNGKYINDVAKSGYCFTSPVLYVILINN